MKNSADRVAAAVLALSKDGLLPYRVVRGRGERVER
jgi:hypothetical protein